MACPENGPCTAFASQVDLCCLSPTGTFPDPCLAGGQPLPPDSIENSLQAASELLWAVTGRQYGTCEVTVRPCRQDCNPCPGVPSFDAGEFGYGFSPAYSPFLVDGVWLNIPPCCPGQCGCTKLEQIDLPYPVCDIIEVLIDGSVVSPTGYRVDEFKKLVRIDGESWPKCQNLANDPTEEDTFAVTLTYGRPVPALIKQATAALACELLKSCVGAPCQLPQRVSSMSRQGVTIGFIDAQEFFSEKRTGIYLVDLAINTFNPHGLTRKPTVYSPDVGPKWRITDT